MSAPYPHCAASHETFTNMLTCSLPDIEEFQNPKQSKLHATLESMNMPQLLLQYIMKRVQQPHLKWAKCDIVLYEPYLLHPMTTANVTQDVDSLTCFLATFDLAQEMQEISLKNLTCMTKTFFLLWHHDTLIMMLSTSLPLTNAQSFSWNNKIVYVQIGQYHRILHP